KSSYRSHRDNVSAKTMSMHDHGQAHSASAKPAHASHHDHAGHDAPNAASAIDPVCGMRVDPNTAAHRHTHDGCPYYFCSAGCRAKFAADPVKYLGPKPAETAPLPAGTIYTCPMHPEIRQPTPGSCPICGMALEPVTAGADTGPSPELVDMTRRF